MKKFIFNFNSKKSNKLKNSKNILGGKGSNLADSLSPILVLSIQLSPAKD